jgi:hypothetical protein
MRGDGRQPDARFSRVSNLVVAGTCHLLLENCHGVIADAMPTIADAFSQREAATVMLCDQWQAGAVTSPPCRHRSKV